MHRLSFPLVSLGSDAESNPDTAKIAEWIAGIKGNEADFITYETDTLLSAQHLDAAFPAAGGLYYAPRLYDVFGISENSLTGAPELNTQAVLQDIRIAKRRVKNFRFSLPSPLSLEFTDRYYHDKDDAEDALTDAFSALCREMRDSGVTGAVLHSMHPAEIELEKLHGTKFLWSVPESELEHILEYTRDIVIPAADVSRLAELFDSYTIRNVCIKDADEAVIRTVLETVERDKIFTAGYRSSTAGENYWKDLAELTVTVDEL